MASLLRQARSRSAELLLEGADPETGSETELLSGSDGAGGPRASCRRCRVAGPRRRLRLAAALGCLALACTLAISARATLGPSFTSSLFRSSVGLDAIPGGSSGSGGGTQQCAVDEEFFAGLCYKKCSRLTQQEYPIRTSAMTCCRAHPCGLFNQRHDMGFCSGFSVAGGNSSSCPHPPGTCLPDEEMLLGQCYQKCSILTNGEKPYRVGAGTCCDEDSEIMCLLPGSSRSKTDAKFNTGGGQGAQAGIHPPLSSLKGVAHVTAAPSSSSSLAASTFVPATTAQPPPSTTSAPAAQPAGASQPALPHWYTEMQANQATAGTTATTGAPASTAAQAAPTTASPNPNTPAPVPDWALDTAAVATTAVPTTAAPATSAPTTEPPTTAAPTTAAPTTEPPTTAAPSTAAPTTVAPTTAAPTTVAPTSVAPTTPAPVTAVPTAAPTIAPTAVPTAAPTAVPTAAPTTPAPTVAPTTAAPATAAPTYAPPASTVQPSEQVPTSRTAAPAAATTKAPQTTMPDWLQEIVAKPEDASSGGASGGQAARQAPAPVPVAAAAPAPAPAGSAGQELLAQPQAPQMPDWAAEMLNDQGDQTQAAPQAPSRSALAKGAPPVPDWAKEYVNGAE